MIRAYLAACVLLVVQVLGAQGAETLRVVQFNGEWLVYTADETDKDPWGSDFGNNEHYERVAGVIETLEPDIVNLCEITNQASVEYLVALLHDKGLSEYEGYHVESTDTGTGQDIAVIARVELESVDGHEIRRFHSGDDSRYRIEYEYVDSKGRVKKKSTSVSKNIVYYVHFGGRKIGFLGLHLKAFPSDDASNAQREAQATVAARILEDQIVGRGYTPIALGDFNDYDPEVLDVYENKTETNVLTTIKNYDESTSENELFNAASRIGRQLDRYTAYWDKNGNDQIDDGDGFSMIDHVLIHSSLEPHVSRCFIDHGHGRDVSDHWPVIVDLVFGE